MSFSAARKSANKVLLYCSGSTRNRELASGPSTQASISKELRQDRPRPPRMTAFTAAFKLRLIVVYARYIYSSAAKRMPCGEKELQASDALGEWERLAQVV